MRSRFPVKKFCSNSNFCSLQSIYSIAIAMLIVSQISLPGVVLCFGTDGHFAIERESSGSCSEYITTSEDDSLHYGAAVYSSGNHCGPCVDVRISNSNKEDKLTTSGDKTSQADIYAFVVSVLDSLQPQNDTSQRIKAHEFSFEYRNSGFPQTTVLTC